MVNEPSLVRIMVTSHPAFCWAANANSAQLAAGLPIIREVDREMPHHDGFPAMIPVRGQNINWKSYAAPLL
jgi:hypothetical protein